jgi:hypothetical protein
LSQVKVHKKRRDGFVGLLAFEGVRRWAFSGRWLCFLGMPAMFLHILFFLPLLHVRPLMFAYRLFSSSAPSR